jgi:paraquat-inducible protein A
MSPPSILACKTCGQVHAVSPVPPGSVAICTRCGGAIERRTHHDLHRTAAFSLAALILYVPANLFPILRMERYGLVTENTVWSGTVALYKDGDILVAVIVFLASILIPLLKLLGLFTLVAASRLQHPRFKLTRTWVYHFIEGIGRWAMLDVFVLAVLVSLVKLQRLATILPGPGLLAFTAVVVFTLLASASFDPQLIWERPEDHPA